jgi:hypothetical protein
MNRPFMFAFGAALAGAAALHGQTTDTASARSALPVLVSDLTIRSTDSPLVRAAKTTVAARVGQASRSTGVIINDAYLKTHPGGKISEARETAPPPPAAKPQMRPETDFPVITPKPKGTDPR